MSSPYDRYDPGRRRPRASWSHWVPLVLTVTVATVGVAAWVWNQRSGRDEDGDEDGDEDPDLDHNTDHVYADLDYENADYGDNPAYGATTRPSAPAEQSGGGGGGGGGGWGSHMSGALLRRTPSPQQLFDSARKTVAAGVTAAGAAVGSALAIIREEDKGAYADHETWSEEADAKKSEGIGDTGDRRRQQQRSTRKKRRVVAVVVSAENSADDLVGDGFHEHAVGLATGVWLCLPSPCADVGFAVHPLAYPASK